MSDSLLSILFFIFTLKLLGVEVVDNEENSLNYILHEEKFMTEKEIHPVYPFKL